MKPCPEMIEKVTRAIAPLLEQTDHAPTIARAAITVTDPDKRLSRECSCMEIAGEDPRCILHGESTQWAKENPDFGAISDRLKRLREALEDAGGKAKLAADALGNSPAQFDSVREGFRIIERVCDAALSHKEYE